MQISNIVLTLKAVRDKIGNERNKRWSLASHPSGAVIYF